MRWHGSGTLWTLTNGKETSVNGERIQRVRRPGWQLPALRERDGPLYESCDGRELVYQDDLDHVPTSYPPGRAPIKLHRSTRSGWSPG